MKLSAEHAPVAVWGPPGDSTSTQRLALAWDTCAPGIGTLICCGLNPSTAWADAGVGELDPTPTRVHRFARVQGVSRVCMINLYPHRHTDPRELWAEVAGGIDGYGIAVQTCDAVTGLNLPDPWIVVAAWGATAPRSGADQHWRHVHRFEVHLRALGAGEVWCWGTTRAGHPRHPLYLPDTAQLTRWWSP